MAGGDTKSTSRQIPSSSPRTHRSVVDKRRHETSEISVPSAVPPPTLDELRKSRIEYFSKACSSERPRTMKYVYDQPISPKQKAARGEATPRRSSTTAKKRDSKHDRRQHHSECSTCGEESENDRVYDVRTADAKDPRTPDSKKKKGQEHRSRSHVVEVDEHRATKPERIRRTPQRRHTTPVKLSVVPDLSERPLTPPSKTRRSSTASLVGPTTRAPLRRTASATAAKTEVSLAKSTATSKIAKKPTVFGSLFQSRPPLPEKKVSCLTCGDDEIPMSKSARLPCKHRMCHSCLKRVFKMSITDPAHMPPRCCTDDHIDLKHVDKLFSQDFKKNWNRKFLEHKTKNRVYCIGKNCGEWIKPNHISLEHGRKIGKCKRCGTRVCAICNNKAHNSRDCPKDPATKKFIDTAKEKGWQKCFSCSAMVELKEGCNHMTCRCTAEFCMVCGLKWKSCDCPWFNYEAVDAHLGNPQRYQEELERRRDQEQRDEVLARRMEVLGIDEETAAGGPFGLGNAAGHHMNQNFIQQAREALTANYQNAEQAARGLLNGWYTGRDNRMPDIPEHVNLEDLPQILRQQSPRQRRRVQEDEADTHPAPRRRNTARRRNNPPDMAEEAFVNGRYQPTEEDRAQERRIREWATGVTE